MHICAAAVSLSAAGIAVPAWLGGLSNDLAWTPTRSLVHHRVMEVLKALVGVTDDDWFEFLRAADRRSTLEEVNFWQPSGGSPFRALQPGEPFLFKLHAPRNVIVGGGFFGHFSLLPVDLTWTTFGLMNGAPTRQAFRQRIADYRKVAVERVDEKPVGCILLQAPFFFDERDHIPVPEGWSPNIVRYRGYDLREEPGLSLWARVQERLHGAAVRELGGLVAESGPRHGHPRLVLPRLGQGSFRVAVLDAYERRCAITGERTLPVLESAHIIPFAAGGESRVDNGLALRADLHALYDSGYVTVTSDHRVEVSRRIREEFENGRDYYALHGRSIRLPSQLVQHPRREGLELHARTVFRG